MSVFKIGLIKKNYDNTLINPDRKTLIDALNKHTEFFETNDLMKALTKILNLDKTSFPDTEICHESSDHIYQIVHIPMRDNVGSLDSFNQLGTMMLSDQVHGDCIIIKMIVKEDRTCEEDSLCPEDLIEILNAHTNPTLLKISCDGYVEETDFREITTSTVYAPIDINCFGFNLICWITINFEGQPVNQKVTRLCGDKFVLGDAYVVNRFKSGYTSFTKSDLSKLDKICWLSYEDRVIEQGEKILNDKVKIFNRYTVIREVKEKFSKYLNENINNWDEFFKKIKTSRPENYLALERSMQGKTLEVDTLDNITSEKD